MIIMGLLENIGNRLFKRESVSSNIATNKRNLKNRISLKSKHDTIDYELGMKIMSDTQVATGYDILKYLLSSKQWVLIANENDTDGVVYDFINNMFFNMETEVNEIVKQEITAIPWGFCVHEQLFDLDDNGRLYLKNAVPLHIKTLQEEPFVYDDNGELVAIHQEYDGEFVNIPVNKILKYSFNANYDEDYGRGLLYDFKPIVEDKVNINNWLMTYMEKHESPTLYGKIGDPVGRDALLDAFDDLAEGTTGLTIDREDDIGVLESSHRGEAFFDALQYKDNEILRRYYLGNLLLGDNSQTGSYAQSNTQLEFGKLVFDGILEEIANGFQKQIINQLVVWNFKDINLAPTFSFDKFSTGDIQALFNVIKPLIDSGVIDSENKAVQDSIALMFKKETGLNYENEEPVMPVEDFEMEPTDEDSILTDDIISNLDDLYVEST